jgi:hypothetical protein
MTSVCSSSVWGRQAAVFHDVALHRRQAQLLRVPARAQRLRVTIDRQRLEWLTAADADGHEGIQAEIHPREPHW